MSGIPRDPATPKAGQTSLRQSLSQRRAIRLLLLPKSSAAKKLALSALISLAAVPAAVLADAGIASAAISSPSQTTSPGANVGHPVRLLQKLLHVAVDGIFGPKTLAAVKAYQRANRLKVDGIVGPKTWGSLGYKDAQEISALPLALPKQQAVSNTASSTGAQVSSNGAESDGDGGSLTARATSEVGPSGSAATQSTSTGSAFALCVANREAGSPGSTSAGTVSWTIEDAPYEGGFQWLNSTWLSQGGGRYAPRAIEATPSEQIAIFEAAEPSNPGAWPVTVPACGG